MKKVIISLVCILASLLILFSVNMKANSYSQKSMEIINQLGKVNVNPGIFDDMTANEIDDVIAYMEKYPERVLPWYLAQISDYIYRFKKDEQKAVQYYYRGLIRIQEDVKMCKGPYAEYSKILIDREVEDTQVIRIKYMMKNPQDIYNIYINELNWDETNKRYANPYWSCVDDEYGKVPLSSYDSVLKQYRTRMRSAEAKKLMIDTMEQSVKENKTEYEKMIKEYLK